MSNIVELNLDDTLADFEVQDWIDNVFSVQYPYIQATIKKGCHGNCGDKYKEENEELRLQNQNLVVMLEQERTLRSEEKSLQEICRLEQQIEKMKLCQNCKYGRVLSCDEPCLYCSRCFANEGKERLKDYWELEG